MRDRDPPRSPWQEGAWGVRGVDFTAFCAYFEHAGVGFECCITPLTATHCGCASCAMACGGEVGLHRPASRGPVLRAGLRASPKSLPKDKLGDHADQITALSAPAGIA